MKKSMKKSLALVAAAFTLAGAFAPTLAHAEGANLPVTVDNEGTPISGGTLKVALVGDPFAGVFNQVYYSTGPDSDVIDNFMAGLYGYDENFVINDTGFAKLTFDKDNKKVTIKIPENTKWDDGEPLTIDDVIYPYYVIGHKDYAGIRYGDDFENVVGMAEYHEGKAEEISGLKRVDDWTLEVSYKEFPAGMLQAGGGVSQFMMPKHVFEKIPVAEQLDSDAVRKNPVGNGPFRVKSITPGESVTFEANEYYYKGKPKVDGMQLDVVNPSTAVSEMKAGNYDIAKLSSDEYPTYADATNFKTLGRLQNAMSYIGFKMGKWNADKKEVEYDPSRVVSNKALRQAMGYAIDNAAIGEKFYNGLRTRANTTIPALFKDYNDSSIEGYTYQPEKSKQILADAGFVDKDGDGFVEDPNGKSFTLKFASMQGGATAEPIAQYYIDSWKQVGINVELVDGRLMEFNAFYDLLKKDGDVDVYQAAFGVGGDPNPINLFGRKAAFNYTRWATEENDKLLDALGSTESFDEAFRKKAFSDWQKYFTEEAPVIPTLFRNELISVNNRVKHYDFKVGSTFDLSEVELTADQPVK
ncbi:oligopeptide ABC transporter substrate-binding protein [Abiotrophia defectiva]|jgi:hypothetical protein|uniref:oligopeptide ABC transporter substrate-binding protein n=1 Tax=Abiotrophia defectiva TaxID=46125 RepID=UPI0022815BFB|nr:oligopeptide ABC transporter substrate-binding protein [Abiotrophia defectiva]MCY7224907.1 oligopeptide ABC transporter substrate-binding protein [Abiotrophia defectiva]